MSPKRDRPVIYSPHGQGIRGYCPNNLGWPGYGTAGAAGPFGGHSTLGTGLKVWYNMNEASGTRVDSTGNEDLTDVNTVGSTTGIIGNAADFTAANSEILQSGATPDIPAGATDYSVSFFYQPQAHGANEYIVCKSMAPNNQDWWIYHAGVGRIYVATFNDAQAIQGTFNSGAGTVVDGTWYHVVMIHNWSGSELSVILDDGTPQTDTTIGTPTDEGAKLTVGARRNNFGFIDGYVDLLGIWDKVLSAGEVTDLRNGGAGLAY